MNLSKKQLISVVLLFIGINSYAQKQMLSYPFQFEKGFMRKEDNDAYIMTDKSLDKLSIAMHDNRKADYVLLDKSFKVISKFNMPFSSTIFNNNEEKYLGGNIPTGTNSVNFVYKINNPVLFAGNRDKYKLEVVDFDKKTVSEKDFIEKPKVEKEILSFSDYNEFYMLTCNNKTNELLIYKLKSNGEIDKNSITIKIPEGKSKKRNELSEYLQNSKLVRDDEEVGLNSASQSSKVFSTKNKISFVINDNAYPTHILEIDKNTMQLNEKFIDHSAGFNGKPKDKSYVNSYLYKDKIFSLILNKKSIVVATYNESDGKLLNEQEITEENMGTILAQLPTSEERMGKKKKEKDIDGYKTLIKALTKGTEGLSVTQNKAGQFIITVGTYDPISTGGGGGSHGFSTTVSYGGPGNAYTQNTGGPTVTSTWNSVPGNSSYISNDANYYKSLSFKMIVDPNTFKIAKGKLPESLGDQIKDYSDEAGKKVKVKKQFAIGEKQYFSYYDKNEKSYIIEEIAIAK